MDHRIIETNGPSLAGTEAADHTRGPKPRAAQWLQSGVLAFVEDKVVAIRLPEVVDPAHGLAVLETLDAVLHRTPRGAHWKLDLSRLRQIPAYLLVSLFSFGKALRSVGGHIDIEGINPVTAGVEAPERLARLLPHVSSPPGGTEERR